MGPWPSSNEGPDSWILIPNTPQVYRTAKSHIEYYIEVEGLLCYIWILCTTIVRNFSKYLGLAVFVKTNMHEGFEIVNVNFIDVIYSKINKQF